MDKLKITENQARILAKEHLDSKNKEHLNESTLNDEEKTFLSEYYGFSDETGKADKGVIGAHVGVDEGKRATVHHHGAQGNSKKSNLKDGTYDTGDSKKRISLNAFYELQGDEGMERLAIIAPELTDTNGDEYIYIDYERRGMKGIRVLVRAKDEEAERAKANNGNYIHYSNPEKLERIFDGSNIFVSM